MNTEYEVKGNLALKPCRGLPGSTLTLAGHAGKWESIRLQILDQMFDEYQSEPPARSVAAVLGNMAGTALLHSRRERVFALVASGIACIALFYFSFFA